MEGCLGLKQVLKRRRYSVPCVWMHTCMSGCYMIHVHTVYMYMHTCMLALSSYTGKSFVLYVQCMYMYMVNVRMYNYMYVHVHVCIDK